MKPCKAFDWLCYRIYMALPLWACRNRAAYWLLGYAGRYGYGWYDIPESERATVQQEAK